MAHQIGLKTSGVAVDSAHLILPAATRSTSPQISNFKIYFYFISNFQIYYGRRWRRERGRRQTSKTLTLTLRQIGGMGRRRSSWWWTTCSLSASSASSATSSSRCGPDPMSSRCNQSFIWWWFLLHSLCYPAVEHLRLREENEENAPFFFFFFFLLEAKFD